MRLYFEETFLLMSTKGSLQHDGPPCIEHKKTRTHLVVVQNDESDLGPRPVADLHQLTVGTHRGVAALHAAVLRRLLGPGPGAGGGVVAVQGGPNDFYSGKRSILYPV